MAFITYSIELFQKLYPTLHECYGFDKIEIEKELQDADNENISFEVTDDFEDVYSQLEAMKQGNIYPIDPANDDFIDGLILMAAIDNRNRDDLHQSMVEACEEYTMRYRPDMLKAFVALNKGANNKGLKISVGGNKPIHLKDYNGWFTKVINDGIYKFLGDITLEEAECELKENYSDLMGRNAKNPYLNYIITGTYFYITKMSFASARNKVSVDKIKILLQYLKCLGLVQDGDALDNVNTLQSTVKSLISSNFNPIQRHVRALNFKGIHNIWDLSFRRKLFQGK